MASGSEYRASSHHDEDEDGEGEIEADDVHMEEQKVTVEYKTTTRGRKVAKQSYAESPSEDDIEGYLHPSRFKKKPLRSIRDDDDDGILPPKRRYNKLDGFLTSDEDHSHGPYQTRSRFKKPPLPTVLTTSSGRVSRPTNRGPQQLASHPKKSRHPQSTQADERDQRNARRTRSTKNDPGAEEYVHMSESSVDAEGELDDAPPTSDPEPEVEVGGERQDEVHDEGHDGQIADADGKPYALRRRKTVNYAIPQPLEELPHPPPKAGGKNGGNVRNGWGGGNAGGGGGRSGGGVGNRRKGPGWSASGAELGRWMGMGGDDSVRPSPSLLPPTYHLICAPGLG
jgi:ATPase family AAA domain-containing protein 2